MRDPQLRPERSVEPDTGWALIGPLQVTDQIL